MSMFRRSHEEIEPLLAIYRELDEVQQKRVDRHVQRCAACARQLAAFQTVDRQLAALREHDRAQLRQRFQHSQPDLGAYRALNQANGRPAQGLSRLLAALHHPVAIASGIAGAALLLAVALLFASWVASLSGQSLASGDSATVVTATHSVAIATEPAREETPGGENANEDKLGHVAYVQEGDIWMIVLPDGEPQRLTEDGENYEPRWSPSGEWLAFRKDKFVWVLNVRAPEEAYSLHTTAGDVSMGFAWSPTADRLAFTAGTELQLLDAQSGTITTVVSLPDDGETLYRLLHPFWNPDGTIVAYEQYRMPSGPAAAFQGEQGLWLVGLGGGAPAMLYDSGIPEKGEAILAGWTSDGRYILFWQGGVLSASLLADGAPLYALPVSGDQQQPEPVALTVPAAGAPAAPVLVRSDFLAPAPHSTEVAITLGGGRDTWVNKQVGGASPETAIWRSYTPEGQVTISPAWSPDGQQLAYVTMPANAASPDEALWARRIEVSNTTERRQLVDDPAYRDENPLWSATGSHLLFARIDRDERVSLWLLPAGGGEAQEVVGPLSPPPPGTGWAGVYGYVEWSQYYDWWRGRLP